MADLEKAGDIEKTQDVYKRQGIYRIYSENNFIGLGINKEKKLKRDVII